MSQQPIQNNIDAVNAFLMGHNPMERIISMECDYQSDKVSVIYVNQRGEKRIAFDEFKPFCWAKRTAAVNLFKGDRTLLSKKMREYGISCKSLRVSNEETKPINPRLESGYRYMFYATRPMTYNRFLKFFEEAEVPIYKKRTKGKEKEKSSPQDIIAVSPIEQHMISTGKRLFKGYEQYDELKRLVFDLETQGLNPTIHAIDQIGIRTNKGFEKILTIVGNAEQERRTNELKAIIEFFQILRDEKADIVSGYNSENFDWNFIAVRCEVLGTSMQDVSKACGFNKPIYKRKSKATLKLGGETEDYYPTIMWGHNIIDALHAVRRAQAIDSNMQSGSLKYVTKYLKQKKDNRVYVPGDKIGTIWRETDKIYAFNNTNGDWYKITDSKPLSEGYELSSGRYIVERYLLDDLWETDKVELKLNESNFLVSKILPTSFSRACTMGTAGIWKLIMFAWCYENNLAIPSFTASYNFTGGLSRLLKTGFVQNIAKLDFNSLYPSIILTWMISSNLDITNSMLNMLNYVLTERERYKGLKKAASKQSAKIVDYLKSKLILPEVSKDEINEMKWKDVEAEILKGNIDLPKDELEKCLSEKQKWDAEESTNDKKQLPLKILGNSYFGSFGAPNIFPFGDQVCAEKTTCIGRMSLRLMISHFTKLGYEPIVGDSFTPDTPLFIKYNDSGLIDIKPISELVDESNIKTDVLGREYDTSKKQYQVLCRSGWYDVEYIYRHKANKPIYTITEGDMEVSITEDHSLFNEQQQKIKPSEINENTSLEYYVAPIKTKELSLTLREIQHIAKMIEIGVTDRIPMQILNAKKENRETFLQLFDLSKCKNITKTLRAQLNFIKQ